MNMKRAFKEVGLLFKSWKCSKNAKLSADKKKITGDLGFFRKDMSVAQWDAARGTAEVVVKKGKAWIATGVTRGSQHLAFIEEIV
jgi:hypothetical protein